MTEAQEQSTQPLSEYDQLRYDPIIPEDLRTRWIKADQAANWMTFDWNKIIGDEDLTSEARVRRAQEVYDARAPKVEAERKKLRQDVLKAAEREEKRSVPTPKGASLEASTTDEHIAAQNEMFRLQRNIEKRQNTKGPFAFDPGDYLREQYQKGLEQGGVAGTALCRGVLMAASDMGLSDDSWLPREDKHREALDKARRLHYIANSISTSAPSIPRALQPPRTLSRRPERNRARVFMQGRAEPVLKAEDMSATADTPTKKASKRKKAWK